MPQIEGVVFTYRRPVFGSSIPDVTFISERIAGMIRDWRMSEELTGSDHQYILFELTNPEETRPAARPIGWSVKKLDRDRLWKKKMKKIKVISELKDLNRSRLPVYQL